jgi:hypothetical protein
MEGQWVILQALKSAAELGQNAIRDASAGLHHNRAKHGQHAANDEPRD